MQMFRLLQAIAAGVVALVVAQEATPPAPPPPVVESDGSEESAPGRRLRIIEDPLTKATREAETSLQANGITYTLGAWDYGDYKNAADIVDAAECAKTCQADEGCYHWNFRLQYGPKCVLKNDSGSVSGGPNWITGHSTRWYDKYKDL
eukprot:gnl/TRDRNA2_/TRDRNA2_182845_c0_seq1.p1 gnl/TRDRNA2_/TRDRNA2_182845_c0~~gnl/TRDRNA2_/TRDRNA2_182845_c0_seq1.p1  ORF type:complete len:148 (+),score=26.36 gnl/TRDRNA2_/TRDRNA2_182845_c0_seq1:32-475(+)